MPVHQLKHSTFAKATFIFAAACASHVAEAQTDKAINLSEDPLEVAENASQSYSVTLSTQPTGTVTVTISGHAGTDLTLDKTSLEFTGSDWDTAQSVRVTAGTDADALNDAVTLTHSASGADYGSVSKELGVTVTDTTQVKLSAVLDTRLNEGESTTISATIPKTLDATVTITVSSVRTSGRMSEEVLSAQRTLTIAAGSLNSAGTVTFSTADDHEGLGTSQYEVTLTADHARVDPVTVRVVVREDDNTWIFLQPNPTRIFENGGPASLRAARNRLGSDEATLDVSLSPSNLATLSGTRFTFPPGAVYSTETLTVTAVDNNVDGTDQTLTISATAAGGRGYRTPSPAQLTIVDDDGTEAAEVALRLSPIRVREGLVSMVTAESTKALSEGLTITVSATPGHADTLASDFALSANTVLTIPPGGTRSTGVVTIATVDDQIPESRRTREITVSGTVPAESSIAAPADQVLTILEDDITPEVAIVATPPTISEDGGVSKITLRALQPLANTVTVTVRPPGSRAALSTNTVLTIGPGQTESTGSVTLTALDDSNRSNNVVTVSGTASPRTAYLRSARVYIIDDDFDQPTLSVNLSPETIYEGDVCTVSATLSEELQSDVTVTIAVDTDDVDHTATSNDYTLSSNRTLTIAAGSTSSTGTVTFTATDDEFYGPLYSRQVSLEIESLTGIDRLNVVKHSDLSILEDERYPGATLRVTPARIGEDGGLSVVTAQLNTKLRSDLEVTISSIPVLPATASDFTQTGTTLTITAGTKDSTGTVQVTAVDDAVLGLDKHVVVSGSLVVSEPQRDRPVRFPYDEGITITDDDLVAGEVRLTDVTLSLDPASVAENAGATAVRVTTTLNVATRSSATAVTVSVHSDSTATSGTDYEAISDFTVTVGANQSRATGTFTFTPKTDGLAEGDETVVLAGTASGLTVSPATLLLIDIDNSGSRRQQGPPAITLWTDKLGYSIEENTRVYLDVDPKGDEREYTLFVCRENIDTGERLWLAPGTRSTALQDQVVDYYGQSEATRRPSRLRRVEKELIWEGNVPEPGLWHFVVELRSPGAAQVLKTAFAKFVVARKGFRLLSRRGFERVIAEDTTLASDWVYNLGGRVSVKSGATLTIEAGTLVRAWGAAAAIIVEPGGRIVVRGRREAPVVMTCAPPLGERVPGCWGGIKVFGRVPTDYGPAFEEATLPDGPAPPREGDKYDSSGELRYLRVEFAGGLSTHEVPSGALEFHGVGAGTVIDHVQVHASLGDGIVFQGGTAHCSHCVSSEARRDSLAWSRGWQGSAQYLYIQQGSEGACGIRGSSPGQPSDGRVPALWNVTLVGGYNIPILGGAPGRLKSIGPGIFLEGEAAVTVQNLLAMGFAGFAIDGSAASFSTGRSNIGGAILTNSGYRHKRSSQVSSKFEPYVEYLRRRPDLLNVRYEANPDPRPRSGSEALRLGNAEVPWYNGLLSRSAYFVGAFRKRNWLAEWTFFGPERDYEVPDE